MRTSHFLSLLILSGVSASAQQAYWVTESNINVRGLTVVKVYDFSNQLIAKREIHRKVDISRKKECRMLDRIVRTAVREQASLARRARKSSKEVQIVSRG